MYNLQDLRQDFKKELWNIERERQKINMKVENK